MVCAAALVAPETETDAAKRAKIRRAILWYAKKTKMLEILEEAFPASLKMGDLLRYELYKFTLEVELLQLFKLT